MLFERCTSVRLEDNMMTMVPDPIAQVLPIKKIYAAAAAAQTPPASAEGTSFPGPAVMYPAMVDDSAEAAPAAATDGPSAAAAARTAAAQAMQAAVAAAAALEARRSVAAAHWA